MPNDQLANAIEAPGRSKSAAAGDDGGLLALEAQLDDLVAQLLAAQEANSELIRSSDQLLLAATERVVQRERRAVPPSIRVAPIAKLRAAIVHSSMQVAPCQPNISISATERPIEISGWRVTRRSPGGDGFGGCLEPCRLR
jgi:hypothetical protein